MSASITSHSCPPSEWPSSGVCAPIGAVGRCVSPEDWLQLSAQLDWSSELCNLSTGSCSVKKVLPWGLLHSKSLAHLSAPPPLSLKHTQTHAPPHTVRSRDNILVESFLNSADVITYHYLCQSASFWRLQFKLCLLLVFQPAGLSKRKSINKTKNKQTSKQKSAQNDI